MTPPFRLLALPLDGRTWRVEWIGRLRRRDPSRGDFEVDIAFRRMRASHVRLVPTLVLRVYTVSASQLCAMPLRSLWKNGEYVGLQESIDCTLKADIPAAAPKSVIESKISAHFEGMEASTWSFGDHLIPRSFGPPRLLRVSTRLDGEKLPMYIPLFEIARAWFLRDSELTSLMLSYKSKGIVHLLVDPSQTSLADDRVLLTVRDGVSASSVPTVAMVVLDTRARKACNEMILNFASCNARNKMTRLEAMPPIEGLSTLKIQGEIGYINGKKSLIVYSLSAVELPKLPTIEWLRETSTSRTKRGKDDDYTSNIRVITRLDHTAGGILVHPGFETPKGSIHSHTRFETALLGIPLIYRGASTPISINPANDIDKKVDLIPADEPSHATSGAGESGGRGALPKFKLVEARKECESHLLPPTFDSVHGMMKSLNAGGLVRAATATGVNWVRDERFGALTLINSERRWAYTATGKRKCVVLELFDVEKYAYFFEVERRFPSEEIAAGLVWRHDFRRFIKINIDTVLDNVVLARGSWRDIRHPYQVITIPHKFVNASTFASWLEEVFTNALKPKKHSR